MKAATLLFILALAVPLAAQTPAPAGRGAGADSARCRPPIHVGSRVGDLPTGYDDGGRRDPFASLIVAEAVDVGRTGADGVARPDGPGQRGAGRRDRPRRRAQAGDTMLAILEATEQAVVHGARRRTGCSTQVVSASTPRASMFAEEADAAWRPVKCRSRCARQERRSDENHSLLARRRGPGGRHDARRRRSAPPQAAAPPATAQALRSFSSSPIDVDYQAANLRTVLRQLAEIGGVNLIIDPSVPGTRSSISSSRRCRGTR